MPHTDMSNPLGESDLAALNEALAGCESIRTAIARAEASGLDMKQLSGYLSEQERLARGLKANFFPNQS